MMDFAILLAILAVLGLTSAYDKYDDFAETIPKPDSDGYMESIVTVRDSSRSVLENPIQIAKSRIYDIKRKQRNLAAKFVKKVTSLTEPMNQAGIFSTTNAYSAKTIDVTNYGPIPRKFTVHELSVREMKSFVVRPKSNKEEQNNPKNRTFEYKQQTSNNTMGEIIELKRQKFNTSSLLLRFKWPNNAQSYKYYLEDVLVNNFSNTVNTEMPKEMEWHYKNYKNKTPQWTPVAFVVHTNLSTVFGSNDRGKIRKGSTTKKPVEGGRDGETRPNIVGLDIEIWRTENLSRKQEMAKKMLLL